MSAHTPGPWRKGKGTVLSDRPIEGGPLGANDFQHYGGFLIAESVTEDNAARIIHCANVHEELKTALQRLVNTVAPFEDKLLKPWSGKANMTSMDLARAALASAKKEA